MALRELVKDTAVDIDKQIMDVNYLGPVALTKAVLEPMLVRRSGHLVVISSLSGKFGVPKLSSYSASKHALHGFFESLRAETSADNLKITIAVPGFIRTQITVNALRGNGERYGRMLSVQAKGMDPDVCARKILKSIKQEKEEVLIGGWDALSVTFNRFFPRIFSRIIRSHPIRRIESLKNMLSLKRSLTEAGSESRV